MNVANGKHMWPWRIDKQWHGKGGSLSIVWMERGKNLGNLLANKYPKANLRTEPNTEQ